jgi:hypothetical protein
MKQIRTHSNDICTKEGIFLINPTWIHLDEQEIKKKLEKGENLFRVKFEEI